MTNRDVAAAEAAELDLLRDQAAKRQQELAATVEALTGRLHDRVRRLAPVAVVVPVAALAALAMLLAWRHTRTGSAR